jgi:nitrogen fixation protein NifU and related proteins
MNNELIELYQEIILDHNRRPRNYCQINPTTHIAQGHNPLCGDQLTIFLNIKDEIVQDISFKGEGCAISKASASLMTLDLKGKSIEQINKQFNKVIEMLITQKEQPIHAFLEQTSDLASLSGVRQFPARIKCATLAWHTMKAAIEGKKEISTE